MTTLAASSQLAILRVRLTGYQPAAHRLTYSDDGDQQARRQVIAHSSRPPAASAS